MVGATVGSGRRSLHSHVQIWDGKKLKPENMTLFDAKESLYDVLLAASASTYCKAQAQFPSFNRVARISLSFFVFLVMNVPVQETSRVTTADIRAADIGQKGCDGITVLFS